LFSPLRRQDIDAGDDRGTVVAAQVAGKLVDREEEENAKAD